MAVYYYTINKDSGHSEFHTESTHNSLSNEFEASSLAEEIADQYLSDVSTPDSFPIDIEIYKNLEDAEQNKPAFVFKVGLSFMPVFDAQEVCNT